MSSDPVQHSPTPPVPVDLVRDLMNMLDGTSIAELEVEYGDVSVYIQREAGAAHARSAGSTADPNQTAGRDVGHESAEAVVTSSYVGEFHRTGEVPAVGDAVTAGTTLGEIEVLGIRNPVLAPVDGVLAAILIEDEAAVEYGQPLVVITEVGGKNEA